jgi:hypothetical protein
VLVAQGSMLVLRATATRRPRMANTSISCASSVRPPGEAVVMRPHNDCLVVGHYGLDLDRQACAAAVPKTCEELPEHVRLADESPCQQALTGHRPDNVLDKQGGHVTASEGGVALADQCGVGVLGP